MPKNKLKRNTVIAVLAVIILGSFVVIYQKYSSFSSELAIYFNQSEASGVSSKYKEYKAKYKNSKDKSNYFKIKELKKKQPLVYWKYKYICDIHKSDSDVQFKKLAVATQEMCKQYYSYKGYANYVYYRDKYRAQQKDKEDNNDEVAISPWTSQDESVFKSMQDTATSAIRCLKETDQSRRLNTINSADDGSFGAICSVGSGYSKWPDLTTSAGWLVKGATSLKLNRQQLMTVLPQSITQQGWYWCTPNKTYTTHPVEPDSCGGFADTTCGQDRSKGSFCYALQNKDKFIWCTEKGCQKEIATAAPFVCGTSQVIDAQQYPYDTVNINGQCWMDANLQLGTMLVGAKNMPANNGTIEKWCYNNDADNCEADGGLYAWDEAMQYSITSGAQGICPTGWHIPTDSQLYSLENYLKDTGQTCDGSRVSSPDCSTAGTKLKLGGTSKLDFPLAGYNDTTTTDGTFGGRTTVANFWSSSENGGYAWHRHLSSTKDGVGRNSNTKALGFSVRCLKD